MLTLAFRIPSSLNVLLFYTVLIIFNCIFSFLLIAPNFVYLRNVYEAITYYRSFLRVVESRGTTALRKVSSRIENRNIESLYYKVAVLCFNCK